MLNRSVELSQALRGSKFVPNKGPHNLLALDVEKLTMLQKIANLKMPPAMHVGKRAIHTKTYTDQPLKVRGELQVNVSYGDQRAQLPLIVVAGNGPNLMGRNWLKQIQLNWQRIATVRNDSLSLKTLLKQHY